MKLRLLRASAVLVLADPHLLLYPLFNAACAIGICAGALLELHRWLLTDGRLQQSFNQVPGAADGVLWTIAGVCLCSLLLCNILSTVCCVAMASHALERFAGRTPDARRTIGLTVSRLPQIVAWALLDSTVGWAISLLEGRHVMFRNLVARLVGASWAAAAWLAVPILANEPAYPLRVLAQSVAVLRRRWGHGVVIEGTFGLATVAAFLLGLPVTAWIIHLSGATGLTAAGLVVGYGLLCFALLRALHTAAAAALYHFAVTDEPPAAFPADLCAALFRAPG